MKRVLCLGIADEPSSRITLNKEISGVELQKINLIGKTLDGRGVGEGDLGTSSCVVYSSSKERSCLRKTQLLVIIQYFDYENMNISNSNFHS